MFTTEQRDQVRNYILDLAKNDPRVTAGALTGSTAVGAEDEWSDIDIAFGVEDGITPKALLDDWAEVFTRELGALHHWDLPFGTWLYRVFLLPIGLEIDIGVAPQQEFGARGPSFRTLFGTPRELEPARQPDPQYLIGLAWHHVLHARSSIERGKPWRAEYWISAIRDHTLALACLRLGENAIEARGIDRLPAIVTAPFAEALVRSLDEAELRRALRVATTAFISELEASDSALCARLKPLLQQYGAPRTATDC
ncbi:MAG TPA: aminoglycoside 6-adenylyltransferase [Chloroflexia bacterium]|nr:aminoglycoside 6-adenylyltransferase [Chloroflexia bacterium]